MRIKKLSEREKSQKVYEVFQSIAQDYDKMNEVISLKQHQNWKKLLIKMVEINEEAHILDLCCGTGDICFLLASHGANKVVGMDFSENMLNVAKRRNQNLGYQNIDFLHGDVSKIPFEDTTFDRITLSFGLRNVPDYALVLQECFRVLKKEGKVVILEASYPSSKWIRPFFKLYFKHIMPFMGKFFVKKMAEYQWLHDSTEDFLSKEDLKDLMGKVGFKKNYYKSLLLGSAAIHVGKK